MAGDKQTIVLISGANRGLGRGLLELYLASPNHTVIAANRNPSDDSSKSLKKLPVGSGSKLVVVKIDASSQEDPAKAIAQLESQGIEHLDVVIANAGVSKTFPAVKDLNVEDMQEHIVPNVFGVVHLYQAARSLLVKSAKPTWVTMGSSAGSIENMPPVPNAAYGPSKAAVHWITKRIDAEEERIAAIVMDPGWVQTDMGNNGAQLLGFGEKAPLALSDSVTGMKAVIGSVAKESHGGRLWAYDGKEGKW